MQRMDLELRGSALLSVQARRRGSRASEGTLPLNSASNETEITFIVFCCPLMCRSDLIWSDLIWSDLICISALLLQTSQSCTLWRRSGYLCEEIIRGANITPPQGNQGSWCSGCLWKRILNKLPWREPAGYQMSAAAFLPVFPVNPLLMTFFFCFFFLFFLQKQLDASHARPY